MSPSRSRSEQVVGNSHDTDAKGGAQVKSSGPTTSSTGPVGSLLRCVCLTSGESMRLVPVGSTPGGLRRCNLPGAFDLIGAPCDCPCSASGAGVPVWRNSVFVTFCWRLLRSSALLLRFLLHFVGRCRRANRSEAIKLVLRDVSSVCASKSAANTVAFSFNRYTLRY